MIARLVCNPGRKVCVLYQNKMDRLVNVDTKRARFVPNTSKSQQTRSDFLTQLAKKRGEFPAKSRA